MAKASKIVSPVINATNANATKGKKGKGNATSVVTPAPVTPTKSLTQSIETASVDSLLDDLRASIDQNDKKKIRRRLRRLGHRGGLQLRAITVKSINA